MIKEDKKTVFCFLGILSVLLLCLFFVIGGVRKKKIDVPTTVKVLTTQSKIDSVANQKSKLLADSQLSIINYKQNLLRDKELQLQKRIDSFTKINKQRYEAKINAVAYYNDSALISFYKQRYGTRD